MISKHIDSIVFQDVQELLDNSVAESKTIEYKLTLPTSANSDKIPFLAEICSFANTAGGDLLIGIEEDNGVPTSIQGCQVADPDSEVLRLDSTIRTGLDPRFSSFTVRALPLPTLKAYAFLIRTDRSPTSPHKVTANDKFYGRTSAGKYPLDVGELRHAFALSQQIADRIQSFRTDRFIAIRANEAPLQLAQGLKMVLHILPLTAFTGGNQLDIAAWYRGQGPRFQPLGSSSYGYALNLEGVLAYSGSRSDSHRSYTQLYRTGAIEAVEVYGPRDGKRYLPSVRYEQVITDFVRHTLQLLTHFSVEPPTCVFLSFLDAQGYQLGTNRFFDFDELHALERQDYRFPEVWIDDYKTDVACALKPVFDMVWNAFGLIGSYNYDENGQWNAQR